jgi:hypothetical protein
MLDLGTGFSAGLKTVERGVMLLSGGIIVGGARVASNCLEKLGG